jgi:hypothetical protein
MTTIFISLSSDNTQGVINLPETPLFDKSTIVLSLSGIPESKTPSNVSIDWGDGDKDITFNDFFKDYKTDSIIPEILQGKITKLFTISFNHTYQPSPNTLYKSLTAKVSVTYPIDDVLHFNIPLKIRKNDFFEDFMDVDLTNTRFVEKFKREYSFSGKTDNQVFEIVTKS